MKKKSGLDINIKQIKKNVDAFKDALILVRSLLKQKRSV